MVILNLGEENRYNMAEHFKAAAKLADDISATFNRPIELEFEKCYYPYLLYSKKRYAGRMFSSSPDKADYVDIKGLSLVRRDSAPIARRVSQSILDCLMERQNAEEAVDIAKRAVMEVLEGRIEWADVTLSKTLRGSYKNDAQPHLHVARLIRQRTGESLPSGARVPYCFVERHDESVLGVKSLQAEDPAYAKEHGMTIDRLYYVDHQLRSPLTALLEVVCADPDKAIFEDTAIKAKMEELEAAAKGVVKEQKRQRFIKDNKLQPISNFFKPLPKQA